MPIGRARAIDGDATTLEEGARVNRIGIIGGSGLYDMEGVTEIEAVEIETPFGTPSDRVRVGKLDGHPVAFLPRHGRGHRLNPSDINYRANIWALRSVGVDRVLSVSAVGSMREEIAPGHLVFVDQFIDRTRGMREHTFFTDGCVAHVGLGDPLCAALRERLAASATELGLAHHMGGTYVCIEGPQFSTRAESRLYRTWDVSVIGMTNVTEAKLAREAELCYATIAMATDYDVWHDSEADVTVEGVLAIMRENVRHAKAVIRRTVAALAAEPHTCRTGCQTALHHAVMTDRAVIPSETQEALALLLSRYWGPR